MRIDVQRDLQFIASSEKCRENRVPFIDSFYFYNHDGFVIVHYSSLMCKFNENSICLRVTWLF